MIFSCIHFYQNLEQAYSDSFVACAPLTSYEHTCKNRIPKKQPLHVKILVGYILLTVLVVGIIAAVWYEKCVFQEAEQEERAMLEQRCLTCNSQDLF